ncbi:hypothetical protein Gohar_010283 [Gossypium harknessii]|uniref:Uncharacterized protein n=1 Tax=Gossypium harknessii TaxID=34285 RepID=A0A7J9GQD8_9ROSI|nr:hypothetical protein [Gossypium harknessii]
MKIGGKSYVILGPYGLPQGRASKTVGRHDHVLLRKCYRRFIHICTSSSSANPLVVHPHIYWWYIHTSFFSHRYGL